jgi:hypothetical protein
MTVKEIVQRRRTADHGWQSAVEGQYRHRRRFPNRTPPAADHQCDLAVTLDDATKGRRDGSKSTGAAAADVAPFARLATRAYDAVKTDGLF